MPLQRISEVLAQVRANSPKREYVTDWKSMIPAGSRWFPGCPGDPACKVCEGTGYLRMEVPVGHVFFGRVFLCDCTARMGRA
jgi:hypothetical protein